MTEPTFEEGPIPGHCPDCGRKASKKSMQQMRCNYADCGSEWELAE